MRFCRNSTKLNAYFAVEQVRSLRLVFFCVMRNMVFVAVIFQVNNISCMFRSDDDKCTQMFCFFLGLLLFGTSCVTLVVDCNYFKQSEVVVAK